MHSIGKNDVIYQAQSFNVYRPTPAAYRSLGRIHQTHASKNYVTYQSYSIKTMNKIISLYKFAV